MQRDLVKENETEDLQKLLATIWINRWILLLVVAVTTTASALYAFKKPDLFASSVLMAPVEGKNLSGFGNQISGLASLAGVDLGANATQNTVIAMEILESRAFLADFIRRHELAVQLLGTSGWNTRMEKWIYDSKAYDIEADQWKTDENGESFEPTDWDLVETFKRDHLRISQDKDNGTIRLRIITQSPIASMQWAKWIVQDINAHMRKKDIEEARKSVDYLEKKLAETSITGLQNVFFELIENETRTIMLANAREEYTFQVIDPPVKSQEKSEPNRILIIVFGLVVGLTLGTFMSLIRSAIGFKVKE